MSSIIKVSANDLEFDVRVSGDKGDIPVIMLHGFPETNHMYTPLMESLNRENYYCVAPNLRGYSPNARPKSKKSYRVDLLASDVVEIARALDIDKFHLIGHDWGAMVGWYMAHHYEDHLLSWTALSIPHPQAFGEAIANDPEQKKMSAYIKRFQIPWLPERSIRKNDFSIFKRLWKNSSQEEVDDYLSVFRGKGAVTAGLNYYRANHKMLKQAPYKTILGKVRVPTLFVWGQKDFAIGKTGVDNCTNFVSREYELVRVDGGHWLMQTNFPELEKHIKSHLKKHSSPVQLP